MSNIHRLLGSYAASIVQQRENKPHPSTGRLATCVIFDGHCTCGITSMNINRCAQRGSKRKLHDSFVFHPLLISKDNSNAKPPVGRETVAFLHTGWGAGFVAMRNVTVT